MKNFVIISYYDYYHYLSYYLSYYLLYYLLYYFFCQYLIMYFSIYLTTIKYYQETFKFRFSKNRSIYHLWDNLNFMLYP